jgi:G-protein coupled receptor 98
VRLVNVTSGRLSSRGIVANVTILANDDPYGVFEFEPTFLAVDEGNRNVTVRVVRRQGSVGKTRVYYTSVAHNVTVDDVTYNRAEENRDFHPVSGFVDFQPNQTSGSFVLAIMDDDLPEDNETIVVNLTRVALSGGEEGSGNKINLHSLHSTDWSMSDVSVF